LKNKLPILLLPVACLILGSCNTVEVNDTTKPILTATKTSFDHYILDEEISETVLKTYVNVTDDSGEDLTSRIVVRGYSSIQWTVEGTYNGTFEVHDSANNAADPLAFTINVMSRPVVLPPDTEGPVITIDESHRNIIHFVTDEIILASTLLGYATASDDRDGDVTAQITMSGYEDINWGTLGDYKIFYRVSDQANNFVEDNINITIQDISTPVIRGERGEYVHYIGMERPSFENVYTAEDEFDGDLTSSILFSYEDVDWDIEGDYVLTIEVVDTHGNTSKIERVVRVLPQTEPSIVGRTLVTLVDNPIENLLEGITVTCVTGESIVPTFIDPAIDWSKPGFYDIEYSAISAIGFTSSTVRTIAVVSGATEPSIFFNEGFLVDNTYRHIKGDLPPTILSKNFVRAFDLTDGELDLYGQNLALTIGNNINWADFGTHSIVITALNSRGLTSSFSFMVEICSTVDGKIFFTNATEAFNFAAQRFFSSTNYQISTIGETEAVAGANSLVSVTVNSRIQTIRTKVGSQSSLTSFSVGYKGTYHQASNGGLAVHYDMTSDVVSIKKVAIPTYTKNIFQLPNSWTVYVDSNYNVSKWQTKITTDSQGFLSQYGFLPNGFATNVTDSNSEFEGFKSDDDGCTFNIVLRDEAYSEYRKTLDAANPQGYGELPDFTSMVYTVTIDAFGNFKTIVSNETYKVYVNAPVVNKSEAIATTLTTTTFQSDNDGSKGLVVDTRAL